MTGRRRPDVPLGELPDDPQPGDYWRYLTHDGTRLMNVQEAGNLTGGVWGFSAPNGAGIGTLTKHTVREHENGTASIRPDDGSSNSVLLTGGDQSFHGYLERGEWREA